MIAAPGLVSAIPASTGITDQPSMLGRGLRRLLAAGAALAAVLAAVAGATPPPPIATDVYVNADSSHATLVEPDTFAFGSTIVAAVQAGRYDNGGASNIAFATSTNGGGTWTSGNLPGTTPFSTPLGLYARLTDPAVAYDAAHGRWLVASLALGSNVTGVAVAVSASADGGLTWGSPVEAATATGSSDFDKSWIACDNSASSPFYGRCYVEYDDFGNGNQVHVAYSDNGSVGGTWTESAMSSESVIGGQPVVQPDGTVVMPIDDGFESKLLAYRSTDGGVTWKTKTITTIRAHFSDGNIRSSPLPSAEVDGSGRVYVVWADCRFRKRCSQGDGANDLVFTTSANGKSWTKVTRIPIDSTKSSVDHFLPGLAVDPATSGGHVALGVVYYYYPVSACGGSCELDAGWVSSTDGGKHWSAPTQLAGPMSLSWLPDTTEGRMVGDYMSASFVGGAPHPVYVAANPPTGSSDCSLPSTVCDVALYAAAPPLAARLASRPAGNDPVLSASGDRRSSLASAR